MVLNLCVCILNAINFSLSSVFTVSQHLYRICHYLTVCCCHHHCHFNAYFSYLLLPMAGRLAWLHQGKHHSDPLCLVPRLITSFCPLQGELRTSQMHHLHFQGHSGERLLTWDLTAGPQVGSHISPFGELIQISFKWKPTVNVIFSFKQSGLSWGT